MISLKKVYKILKPNHIHIIDGSVLYSKDGTLAKFTFHQDADFKQVVSIRTPSFWYANHVPISSVYDSFFFKKRYLINIIFERRFI